VRVRGATKKEILAPIAKQWRKVREIVQRTIV